MKELFDALFFPKSFFFKPIAKMTVSIEAFLIIYYTNFFSYLSLYPVSGNFLLFLLVSVVVAPFFIFFLLLGLDLIVAGYDKNHRLQHFYGFTYCPYLFLPFAVVFAKRESFFSTDFGFSLFALLFLWSALLTYRVCEKKRVLASKFIHDLIVFYYLLRL